MATILEDFDVYEILKLELPSDLHHELEGAEGDFSYHSVPYETRFLQKIVPILSEKSSSRELLLLLKTRSSEWDQHVIDHWIRLGSQSMIS